MRLPVYLDHHATTPVDERVLAKMLPFFTDYYGNPSSQDHLFGAQAAEAVERAREDVALALKAKPEEIIFTSGATEADNTVVLGVSTQLKGQGNHIITAATEHKAILDPCHQLESQGFRVTYLSVDEYGLVQPKELEKAITPNTILVSIMAANNEVGTTAKLAELTEVCVGHDVYFHTDAAQAYGYLSIDVSRIGIDFLSVSGHKIYGPKGVGALFARRRGGVARFAPLLLGGGQERGLRSGTLNVPGIVGLGEAARLVARERESHAARMKSLADRLMDHLLARIDGVHLNGHPKERLPHNLSLTISGVNSKAMIQALHDKVALSAGSACTATSVEPSHVLLALGLSREQAQQTIRIGLGRFTTEEEVDFAAEEIAAASERIRKISHGMTRVG